MVYNGKTLLKWMISHIFYVHPENCGKMIPHFDEHIFQRGWLKPPTSQYDTPFN